MDEDVSAVITSNEAVTLGIAEPLDDAAAARGFVAVLVWRDCGACAACELAAVAGVAMADPGLVSIVGVALTGAALVGDALTGAALVSPALVAVVAGVVSAPAYHHARVIRCVSRSKQVAGSATTSSDRADPARRGAVDHEAAPASALSG